MYLIKIGCSNFRRLENLFVFSVGISTVEGINNMLKEIINLKVNILNFFKY